MNPWISNQRELLAKKEGRFCLIENKEITQLPLEVGQSMWHKDPVTKMWNSGRSSDNPSIKYFYVWLLLTHSFYFLSNTKYYYLIDHVMKPSQNLLIVSHLSEFPRCKNPGLPLNSPLCQDWMGCRDEDFPSHVMVVAGYLRPAHQMADQLDQCFLACWLISICTIKGWLFYKNPAMLNANDIDILNNKPLMIVHSFSQMSQKFKTSQGNCGVDFMI